MARARRPELYERFGVPDTPAGRYEMITWQVLIELTLLGRQGEEGRQQGQEVVDLMFRDMDRSLRELGVGDLSVGKEMRKLGETWRSDRASGAGPAGSSGADGCNEPRGTG